MPCPVTDSHILEFIPIVKGLIKTKITFILEEKISKIKEKTNFFYKHSDLICKRFTDVKIRFFPYCHFLLLP